ncbi:hypothetical protein F4820DRAFT_384667 [Hypoxylon rubiginosum]|uniref:Uncharacterized protein n=1 Tax=Hypoxylon rubiginosum TaxID=110542 RepID=A0ACB9ZEK8_9PEZI|nr:hypothetical protein F4820DRAFT_384667 [Hypoxylon rubiginosum]
MAPVTEIILTPIKPDAPADVVASVLDANTQVLLAQPGCLRVRRSPVHEDPSKMRLFVDWASLDQHRAFAADAAVYGPFRAKMGPIVDAGSGAGPRVPPHHAAFTPFPPAVLDVQSSATRAGVTEVLHAYFAPDISEAQRSSVERTMREFVARVEPLAGGGMTGEVALGWTVEDDVQFKGEPCRALVGLLGWTGVDAHVKTREAEGFAEVVSMLRNLEGLKGLEMCHVACTTTERGS